jgi:hypothetical protein
MTARRDRRHPRDRLLAVVVGAAVAATVLAACESDLLPSPSPTGTPEPTAQVSHYGLGATVWYAGLVLRFRTATAELGEHGGRVAVTVSIENPGTEDRTFDIPVDIVAGSDAFEPTRESVLPTIPTGVTAYTTLHYEVVGRTALDDAVVRIGQSGDHQGIVPFMPGTVDSVTLEPVQAKLSGTGNASDLRLTLRSGELRWDLPDWGEELASGSAILTVTYDVTYRGSFSGGFAFTGDNVALKLPDGKVVEARPDGRSQSVGVIGKGRSLRGQMTRFEIPAGLSGPFVLVVRNGRAQGSIRFTLPG